MISRIIRLSIILSLIFTSQAHATNFRYYANYLTRKLDIPSVEMTLSKEYTNSSSIPNKNKIYIKIDEREIITLKSIAHEICHVKQYNDNKHVFRRYISSRYDYNKYYNQRVEIEAREFSENVIFELAHLNY